jgi:hypothetical protein
MAIIICKHCGLFSDESEIIWSKHRDYEAWCYSCVEVEAEELFKRV